MGCLDGERQALEAGWLTWAGGGRDEAAGSSCAARDLDLKSPVELRERDKRWLVSNGGRGRGSVTVMTETMRKRRKAG